MKELVDACGLSCPEPVLRLKRIIDVADEIELLVDSRVSAENCGRFARSKGFKVSMSSSDTRIILTLIKDRPG